MHTATDHSEPVKTSLVHRKPGDAELIRVEVTQWHIDNSKRHSGEEGPLSLAIAQAMPGWWADCSQITITLHPPRPWWAPWRRRELISVVTPLTASAWLTIFDRDPFGKESRPFRFDMVVPMPGREEE